jgi:ribosomal protein S18 acetylase RimI-like enzyme
LRLRAAVADDYDQVVGVVDDWWGRPVSSSLPRLFFDHFWPTSSVAEDDKGLAGFVVAFISPAKPTLGYIHFVGVRPDQRGNGVARSLYDEFAHQAHRLGCNEVRAVTAPTNTASIRFHERLGFSVSEPVAGYNGPGRAMVVLRRELNSS